MTTPPPDDMYLYLVTYTYQPHDRPDDHAQTWVHDTVRTTNPISSEIAVMNLAHELAHRAHVPAVVLVNITLLYTPDRSTR